MGQLTKRMQNAVRDVAAMPDDQQDYAAAVLEEIAAEGDGLYQLSESERALVREGLDDLDAGRIVSPADMEVFWNRHRT